MRRAVQALAIVAMLAPLSAFADVRITEISYDPQGSDTKHEWIEIFNAGPEAVDLSTVKFSDSSNHALNAPPKNGSIGSMTLAANSYAVLAADAGTFRAVYPGVSEVIDTTMSLKNDGGTVTLTGKSGVLDSVTYSSSLGAANDGDSLQLTDGGWIHAAPTPGAANATVQTIRSAPVVPTKATAPKAASKSASKAASAKLVSAKTALASDANDPMPLVNAEPSDAPLSQTAAVGSLGASMWWLAAGALAIIVGAIASVVSRQKKGEWDIVEADE